MIFGRLTPCTHLASVSAIALTLGIPIDLLTGGVHTHEVTETFQQPQSYDKQSIEFIIIV